MEKSNNLSQPSIINVKNDVDDTQMIVDDPSEYYFNPNSSDKKFLKNYTSGEELAWINANNSKSTPKIRHTRAKNNSLNEGLSNRYRTDNIDTLGLTDLNKAFIKNSSGKFMAAVEKKNMAAKQNELKLKKSIS